MVPPFAVNRCKIEKLYNDNLTAGSLCVDFGDGILKLEK